MKTKQSYFAPECEFLFEMEPAVLCASPTTLDPLIEDNDTVVWEDNN